MVAMPFRQLTNRQVKVLYEGELESARKFGQTPLPPGYADRKLNRPWTKEEYGRQTPQQTYALSEKKPFRPRKLDTETIRH
jgi:hypothetical protein